MVAESLLSGRPCVFMCVHSWCSGAKCAGLGKAVLQVNRELDLEFLLCGSNSPLVREDCFPLNQLDKVFFCKGSFSILFLAFCTEYLTKVRAVRCACLAREVRSSHFHLGDAAKRKAREAERMLWGVFSPLGDKHRDTG